MSAETMTFKEYITECELFPYSQENFDLMKEASELALMNHYIESQRFYLENTEVLGSQTFTEGFLMESSSLEQLEHLEETAAQKTEGFKEKAKQFFLNLLDKFINFLAKIMNSSKKLDEKSREIAKMIDSMGAGKLSPEKRKAIIDLCDSSAKSCSLTFAPIKGQGAAFLGKELSTGNEQNNLVKALGSLIRTGKVAVTLGDKYPNALAADNVKSLVNKGILSPDFETQLTAEKGKLKNGLLIDFTNDGINTTINGLKAARKEVGGIQKTDVDPHGAYKDNFAKMKLIIANTMSLYASAHRYRSLIVNGIFSIISKGDAAPKDESKKDASAKPKSKDAKDTDDASEGKDKDKGDS